MCFILFVADVGVCVFYFLLEIPFLFMLKCVVYINFSCTINNLMMWLEVVIFLNNVKSENTALYVSEERGWTNCI